MSAFGNLWDENHTLTVNPDPSGRGKINWELVDLLRAHYKTQHGEVMRRQVAQFLRENRARLSVLRQDKRGFERWASLEMLRASLWNDELLKLLSQQEGTPE